jgi:hypothetical protein
MNGILITNISGVQQPLEKTGQDLRSRKSREIFNRLLKRYGR